MNRRGRILFGSGRWNNASSVPDVFQNLYFDMKIQRSCVWKDSAQMAATERVSASILGDWQMVRRTKVRIRTVRCVRRGLEYASPAPKGNCSGGERFARRVTDTARTGVGCLRLQSRPRYRAGLVP